ncbi:non-homologous end-joining factor 1-like [Pollicipes pollicipes]|uniref:non-homologous end-joining factor 1-like n=1 Tax=Pollicipes pollicipes TaxID=41117 RepID=UPI0018852050|nr:non-homologous end-joining factor 1-like [Pollicipes pollicipes]
MSSSHAVPWRAWQGLGDVLYQFSSASGGYNLLVTNLSEMFSETMDAAAFLQRFQTLNPSLEATGEQVLPYLEEAFGRSDSGAAWDRDVIRLTSHGLGVPLCWEFRLRVLPGGLAARLVRPLLVALGQAQQRERRLLAEVAARDRELDDYRRSGAHLILKGLRTEPLDAARFDAEMAGLGARPADLVDSSAWEALPPEQGPGPLAPPPPASAEPGKRERPAAEEPPKEDWTQGIERRRRELAERLQEEEKELRRKSKKKRLNL